MRGGSPIANRRVLIAKQESLRRMGAIGIQLDIDDFRYVCWPDRGDRAPIVDIITSEASHTL